MNSQDSVYQLASSIAHAELRRGQAEGRVKSPDAFMRKVRDNMLERTAQRGTGWLVEQGLRFDVPIPQDLAHEKPSKAEMQAKRPALCPTCGTTVPYDPQRSVRIIDGWPWSTSLCAMRRRDDAERCHEYQARGVEPALQQIAAAA